MTSEIRINTPATAGALIRHQRLNQGWTQQALAGTAGVSRKFLIDLESGHDRAELGKTMAVLAALGLSLTTATLLPPTAVNTIPNGATTQPRSQTSSQRRPLNSRSRCSQTMPAYP